MSRFSQLAHFSKPSAIFSKSGQCPPLTLLVQMISSVFGCCTLDPFVISSHIISYHIIIYNTYHMTHIIYCYQKNSRAFYSLLASRFWLFFLSLQIGDRVALLEISLLTRQASSPTLRQFQQGGAPQHPGRKTPSHWLEPAYAVYWLTKAG